MIEIKVIREKSTLQSTQGEMFVNGEFVCYTLEDVERPVKVFGATAIPKGTYNGIVNVSNRFKRMMPLLLNVPGFEGVRIHAGNTAKDTHGCILVGLQRDRDTMLQSRDAYDLVMEILGTSPFKIEIL